MLAIKKRNPRDSRPENGAGILSADAYLDAAQKFQPRYQMITSLEVENFRGFRKIELSDLRRINIIVGDNSSGKTAFLEAIFLA